MNSRQETNEELAESAGSVGKMRSMLDTPEKGVFS